MQKDIVDQNKQSEHQSFINERSLVNGYERKITNKLYNCMISKNIQIDPRTYDDIFEEDISKFISNSIEVLNKSDNAFKNDHILTNHKFLLRYFICGSDSFDFLGTSDKYIEDMNNKCEKTYRLK